MFILLTESYVIQISFIRIFFIKQIIFILVNFIELEFPYVVQMNLIKDS